MFAAEHHFKISKKHIVYAVIGISFLNLGIFLFKNCNSASGGDFKLVHHDKEWVFSQNSKKLNVIYFGFCGCSDVCPLALNQISSAYKELSKSEQENIRVIFVSVDHKHDTPEIVANYASNFSPNFIGVTGNEAQVNEAVKNFGVKYIIEATPDSHMGYTVTHSDKVFLLDRNGKILESIRSPKSEEVLKAIRRFL